MFLKFNHFEMENLKKKNVQDFSYNTFSQTYGTPLTSQTLQITIKFNLVCIGYIFHNSLLCTHSYQTTYIHIQLPQNKPKLQCSTHAPV